MKQQFVSQLANLPTLALSPSWRLSRDITIALTNVSLGDGYEQRHPQLGYPLHTWVLEVTGLTDAAMLALRQQLQAWGAVQPFRWTPTGVPTPKVYICRSWTQIQLAPNCHAFQAKFEQVYPPLVGRVLYVNLQREVFTICRNVIDLIGESNAPLVQWTQIAGTPVNLVGDTTLFAQFDRELRTGPFRFRLQATDVPDLYEDVTVYTAPTSTYEGASVWLDCEELPCKAVPCTFRIGAEAPQSLQGSFQRGGLVDGYTLLTWDLPLCPESLISIVWQQNLTGTYTDVQAFAPTPYHVFRVYANVHYRVESRFLTRGKRSRQTSCKVFRLPTQLPQCFHTDDAINGVSAGSCGRRRLSLPINRIGLDTCQSFSAESIGSCQRVTLDRRIVVESAQGFSARSNGTVVRLDLSGGIIG